MLYIRKASWINKDKLPVPGFEGRPVLTLGMHLSIRFEKRTAR
jgi:hypothetical protein